MDYAAQRRSSDRYPKPIRSVLGFCADHPVLAPFMTASAVYLLIASGIVSWLAVEADTTIQRRIAQSPSVIVAVQKPASMMDAVIAPGTTAGAMPEAADVPASWNGDAAQQPADATASAQTDPLAIEQDQPPVASNGDTPGFADSSQPSAWQNLARPFDQKDLRPRIALIVTDLGMAMNATRAAINNLPPEVTLAFPSTAPNITEWIEQSRKIGHENLLAIPMEPYDYPLNDPGPQTLLTVMSKDDNLQRLNWALTRSDKILGILPLQGDKFVTDDRAMSAILDDLKTRGLIFIDGTNNPKSGAGSLARLGRVPFGQSVVTIDAAASRQAIDQALTELENRARQDGQAIAVALPYPVTFERLASWVKTLDEKNIALAPISAVLTQPAVPMVPAGEAPVATDNRTAPAATYAAPVKSADDTEAEILSHVAPAPAAASTPAVPANPAKPNLLKSQNGSLLNHNDMLPPPNTPPSAATP